MTPQIDTPIKGEPQSDVDLDPSIVPAAELSVIYMTAYVANLEHVDFQKHIYMTMLERLPDPSNTVLEYDVATLEQRVEYVLNIFSSGEFGDSHRDRYPTAAAKLIRALGRKSSSVALASILTDIYPSIEDFLQNYNQVSESIIQSTKRYLFVNYNMLADGRDEISTHMSSVLEMQTECLNIGSQSLLLSRDIMWQILDMKSSRLPQPDSDGSLSKIYDLLISMALNK